eukprot:10597141-Prorocentrum_lima.AAC.1
MTSSLVGSEMCIRDRGTGAINVWGVKERGTRSEGDREGTSVPGEPAVSYTHLTLPTICSV